MGKLVERFQEKIKRHSWIHGYQYTIDLLIPDLQETCDEFLNDCDRIWQKKDEDGIVSFESVGHIIRLYDGKLTKWLKA